MCYIYWANMSKNILIAEDEDIIRGYVKDILAENGFMVHAASDGAQALSMIKKIVPDLVVLDLGLPKVSGEAVFAEIKKSFPKLPIIILSARNKPRDIVEGFNLGADDYVSKPFTGEELMARINARLKGTTIPSRLQIADLVLDQNTFEAKRGKKDLELTPTEFRLLEYLMNNKGRVLTREMILNKIWQSSPDIETRVVDVYVGYLRKKVDEGFDNKLIKSVRGFGYTVKE